MGDLTPGDRALFADAPLQALLIPERLLLAALVGRTPAIGADIGVAEALAASARAFGAAAPPKPFAILADAFSRT
jgi:hypothetical protein